MEGVDFGSLTVDAQQFIDPPPQGYDVWRSVGGFLSNPTLVVVSAVSPALRIVSLGTTISSRKDLRGRSWWWKTLPVVKVSVYNPSEGDMELILTELRVEILRVDVSPLQSFAPMSVSAAACQRTRLLKLDLNGSWTVGDRHLECFPRFEHVTTLRLVGCVAIGDGGMRSIAQMPALEYLVLGEFWDVTDAGVEVLSTAPKLHSLMMRGNHVVTADGLQALSRLASLTQLSLSAMLGVSDRMCEVLKGSAMRRLHLHSTSITRAGITAIRCMAFLVHLNLSACSGVDDGSVPSLIALSELQSLHVREQKNLTDVSLEAISMLPSLTILDISLCTSVTDTGIGYLRNLCKMSTLKMHGLPLITSAAVIVAIPPMRGLVFLSVMGCHLLDSSCLDAVQQLPMLRNLNVKACPGISASSTNALLGVFLDRGVILGIER